MLYANFEPVPYTIENKQQKPIILDVPKLVAPAPSPVSAPTTVHLSYPFKLAKKDGSTSWTWSLSFIAFFALIWIIAGLIAFVMSILCFAYDGTTVEKILGLILAFIFGPFYWIYYFASKSYCK